MSLALTLATAKATEQPPVSRFRFGSPCRFVRTLDLVVHILIPQALRPYAPRLALYLRLSLIHI
jgi:hypothetical protein